MTPMSAFRIRERAAQPIPRSHQLLTNQALADRGEYHVGVQVKALASPDPRPLPGCARPSGARSGRNPGTDRSQTPSGRALLRPLRSGGPRASAGTGVRPEATSGRERAPFHRSRGTWSRAHLNRAGTGASPPPARKAGSGNSRHRPSPAARWPRVAMAGSAVRRISPVRRTRADRASPASRRGKSGQRCDNRR